MSVEIRREQESDRGIIHDVTELAFRDMPYSGGDEQIVIERLRAAGALSLSLVALVEGDVIGHIAFSPARAPGTTQPWFALGPVSVQPSHQRRGIGSALIEHGLEDLRARGAAGCILIGDPAFYRRFGFELSPEHVPRDEPPEYFMVNRFAGPLPTGPFEFHGAFYGDD